MKSNAGLSGVMSTMDFQTALEKNRAKIVDLWFDATIRTYPDNPVGSATHKSLEDTFSCIFEPMDSDALEAALDPVIRIRAVQSFTPAQAVGFVFELKSIVKTVMSTPQDDTFDRKVDQIGLAAFNRFMKCREEIFLLKANEAKRRIHSAFKRAGLVTELEENNLPGSNKS
jgi:hypothetical protein